MRIAISSKVNTRWQEINNRLFFLIFPDKIPLSKAVELFLVIFKACLYYKFPLFYQGFGYKHLVNYQEKPQRV